METRLYDKSDIDIIRDELLKGRIIAFPTDTVFGLGCVYDDIDAINAIMKAKNRSYDKSLPMMCSSPSMIDEVAIVSDSAKKLMAKFMPGAITLIFQKKNVPDFVTLGKSTIAIRVPDDEWIVDLIKRVGKPLLVTSANISDSGSLLEWEDVYEQLNGRIHGLVKDNARGESASTIVDVTGEFKVLRNGPISETEIMEVQ